MKIINRFSRFQFLLLVIVICLIWLILIIKQDQYLFADRSVSQIIQSLDNPIFTTSMTWLSKLGEWEVALPVIFVFSLMWFWFKNRLQAVFIWSSTLGAMILALVFKHIVGRERPSSELVKQVESYLEHDSFPSGHVMLFLGFLGVLILFIYTSGLKTWMRMLLIFPLLLLIILIGISRIYLGAHWFSDVIGAYLLGFLWMVVVVSSYRRCRLPS